MLSLKEIIERGVTNYKDRDRDTEADAANVIRGSNTPLLYNGDFVCDAAAHCPRLGLARMLHLPTDFPKTFKDLASHAYGRAMEALVKDLIIAADVEGLATAEEEGYAVKVQDAEGNVIYSARPDLVVFYNGVPLYPCEFKSIQSDNTAQVIYQQNTPKMGACLQIAAQMHFHDIEAGEIMYIQGHYIAGFSMKTKAKYKFDPGYKIFDVRFDAEGTLMLGTKPTIINRHNLESGISLLNEMYRHGEMPAKRPMSLDIFGRAAPYDCCNYCSYGSMKTGVCTRAENIEDGLTILGFSDIVKESFQP